jgi:hypothetical protein
MFTPDLCEDASQLSGFLRHDPTKGLLDNDGVVLTGDAAAEIPEANFEPVQALFGGHDFQDLSDSAACRASTTSNCSALQAFNHATSFSTASRRATRSS